MKFNCDWTNGKESGENSKGESPITLWMKHGSLAKSDAKENSY